MFAVSERSCRIGRDAIIGTFLTVAVVALLFTPSSATTVSVAPGETLTGIADQFGTTVAALEAANNLTDPNTIIAGSVLQVPDTNGVVAEHTTQHRCRGTGTDSLVNRRLLRHHRGRIGICQQAD